MSAPTPPPANLPSILDPSTFAERGQAFVSWEAEDFYPYLAALSVYLPMISATSTTSMSIGTGTKNITIEAGKSFPADAAIRVTNAADINTYVLGTVISYDDETGALSFTATDSYGTGTYSDWHVIQTLPSGQLNGLLSFAAGADIASATTVDLTAATGNSPKITGTTDIEVWTMNAGQQMKCIAGGAFKLVYDATTNNVEGGADYTCAVGDIINLVNGLDGVIRVRVDKQDGKPVAAVGKVLQVVYGSTDTPVSNATAGFVATGLSATITPSKTTSKILARAVQSNYTTRATNAAGAGFRLLRDATTILESSAGYQDQYNVSGGASSVQANAKTVLEKLDSPGTTDPVTYSVTARPFSTSSSGSITSQYDNSVSTIVLMEIDA